MGVFIDFHFLRPFWFLALIPLVWVCYRLWQKRLENTGLESCIDKNLLPHLVYGKNNTRSSLPIAGLLIIWLISIIALAGPTWKKISQPLVSTESAVVIVLDLSPSMRAEDLKPSRIIRAHLKIQDFLSRRKEGLTALVVYAGEAYVVTPLTDDTKTIGNLLPTLKPGILPLPGSNTEMGLSLAAELIIDAKLTKASILLITDNIDESAEPKILKLFPRSVSLSILGLGSEAGSPIPNNGDFLKDKAGNIIIAKRNSAVMQSIATKVNGYYLPLQADTSDIDFYHQQLEKQFDTNQVNDENQRQYDTWHESGPLLLTLMIPLIALIFRRGLVIALCSLFFSFGGFFPSNVYAASLWDSLWKNSNQRALESYKQEEYAGAAKQFDNSQWKGSAYYKNDDYDAALAEFSKQNTAINNFNKGNALAKLQRYDEAIAAYDSALEKKPDLKKAKINKKLVEEIKKQEEDQKQKEEKNQEKSDDNNQKNQDEQEQRKNNEDKKDQTNGNQSSDKPSGTPKNKEQENSQSKPSEQERAALEENKKNPHPNRENEKSNSKTKASADKEDELSDEERQALEQWLRKVPDDPSGLLKRKFEYEHQKRRQLYQKGEWQLPKNNAHQRY
ncbi:MAG: Ca-activated chloride channel family protein [Cellvibrionaceae bacterium]|jgi:Ca-activated chloride channel family protein